MMKRGKTLGTIIGTALLAAAPALLPVPAAAEPKTMIVLSSATYDSGALDDNALALITGPTSDIFLTGTSGNDYLTMKYSKTLAPGTPLVYTNGRSGNIPGGIAVDGLGEIVVAGMEMNDSLKQAYLVLKYSPNFGAQISSAAYSGGVFDKATAVKTDSQNNIYVTGYSNNTINDDFYTIKYNSALVRLSSHAYDSGDMDQAVAIALVGENVIVAGLTKAGGTNNNFRIVLYDSNLKVLDTASFDSGGDEKIAGVAVDSSGNIIVTGRQLGATADFLTVKYDNTFHNILSSAVYDSGDNETPAGIAVDSNDNIIVTGSVANDYLTIKYDRDLNIISTATYNGGSVDQANAVAVDTEDNVIVTGQSYGGTFDYFTIKYNASPKITEVSPLYIGETFTAIIKGNGFVSGSSVAFTDAGISTGAVSFFASGQLILSATLSSSVMLGITTVTVFNVNGESVSNYALAATRLRKTVTAGGSGALAAQIREGPVSVDLPAGTFPQQEVVSIYTVAPVPGDVRQVGQALYLSVSPADTPLQNISVKLPYRVSDLAGYPETGIGLAYYDAVTGWVNLAASVNTTDKTVTAVTKAVNTKFAVVKAGETVGIPSPGGLGGGKVYPNPYRPGSGGYFDQPSMGDGIVFADLGANQSFKLTIVDVAGQLVYSKAGTADASGKYLWDTKTVSGGKAASGVYIYMIKGSGGSRKGKLSIIR